MLTYLLTSKQVLGRLAWNKKKTKSCFNFKRPCQKFFNSLSERFISRYIELDTNSKSLLNQNKTISLEIYGEKILKSWSQFSECCSGFFLPTFDKAERWQILILTVKQSWLMTLSMCLSERINWITYLSIRQSTSHHKSWNWLFFHSFPVYDNLSRKKYHGPRKSLFYLVYKSWKGFVKSNYL